MSDFTEKLTSLFQQTKAAAEKHIWPNFSVHKLPNAVKHKIESLPALAQTEFYYEYGKSAAKMKKQRNVATILLVISAFNFILPLSAGMLYWLYHIKENRIPLSANKALKRVLLKYRLSSGRTAPSTPNSSLEETLNAMKQRVVPPTSFEQPKPRPSKVATPENYDLTIENLKEGFMLDYNLKTWQVTNVSQYDWENGSVEKEFSLVSGIERASLYLKNESGLVSFVFCKQVNIYAIDENLESEILHKGKPYNILTYEEMPYYRENTNTGLIYNMTNNSSGNKVLGWEYYDGQRQNVIRIEQRGRTDFKTWIGKAVSSYDFTSILPSV